ncbi:MAG TPA: hypothetical protein VGG25_20005 [Streptosporangiaceae bacterium]
MPGRRGGQGDLPAPRSAARSQPHPLVALVGRLLLVQSGATAVISLAFWRRSATWLLFALMLAVLLGCLSGLARTGTHLAWVATVVAEGAVTLLGLVRAMSLDYLGGTLFAIVTLGVLLHPAVGRAFTATGSRRSQPGQPGFGEVRIGDASLAENVGGIGGGAG